MQRAILMAAAALCIQAITEMGEQVFMVGDPTDLPENPTKGSLLTLTPCSFPYPYRFVRRVHHRRPFYSTHLQDARRAELRYSQLKNNHQVR